jgi:dimethylglycine dehydrogenase
MSGLDRFIAFDKGDFIGREAATRERHSNIRQRLVLLEIESDDADAVGFEPVWSGQQRVGFVTGGSYGHFVKKSLAMAYIDSDALSAGADLSVSIVGETRRATVLAQPPYDPSGERLRG